jgi:acyl-CoA synthetase (AMP-forming)/AMP-acid ligase II/LPS sulfotransferase NodH
MATAGLAAMEAGTAVPLNPESRLAELLETLGSLHPSLMVVAADAPPIAITAAQEHGIPVLALRWSAIDPAGMFHFADVVETTPPDAPKSDDIALLLATSGTTSQPKWVPLTHRNLLAAAAALSKSLQLGESDRCLNVMPQFHIGGLWDTIAPPLLAGGSVVCGGLFSTRGFLNCRETFAPSWTQLVPAMLRELLTLAEHEEDQGGSRSASDVGTGLRLIRSVSSPLPFALRERAEQVFKTPIIEIYGMTETAGVITSNPLPPASRPAHSVGIVAGPSLKIVCPEGRILPAGQEGEVVVEGESVAQGYLDSPAATTAAFRSAGFHTGDLGRVDEHGYLYLTGRLKDQINRGGEKISPSEIDDALLRLPEVGDAATFAIPHPVLGEEPVAIVVAAESARASAVRIDLESRLRAALRETLSTFKIPRRILVVDAIPRTKGGKLQRRRLAEIHGPAFAQVTPEDAARSVTALGRDADVAFPPPSPVSPLGQLIQQWWGEILRQERVSENDDFFLLGGDSLKAALFVNRLQERYPGEIVYVSSLYDAPTPAAYEAFLTRHHPGLVLRALGEPVVDVASSIEPITELVFERFRQGIAPSLPSDYRSENTSPYGSTRNRPRNPRAVFVLSPPRSGSTLLRAMLAGHPQLFSPPELYLLSYDTMAERRRWFARGHSSQLEGAVRALMQLERKASEPCAAHINQLEDSGGTTRDFYQHLQALAGHRMLVDKTPNYSVHAETLRRAEMEFHEPLFVHLTRHPYGMIRSFEEANMAQLWWPRLAGPDATMDQRSCPYSPRRLGELLWLLIHRNIRQFLAAIPAERQHRLSFEQLVAAPEESMKAVCQFLDLPYTHNLLEPLADPRTRMTDGVRDVSRMIGDPKFHSHRGIEPEAADLWKSHYEHDFLGAPTWETAGELGFVESVESAGRRITVDI